MSLYGAYIRERLGDGIIEHEYGFVTYRILNGGKTIYIVDVYTTPDFRRTGLAAELADKAVAIAKAEGATECIGTVTPSANNSTDSINVLLRYGMKLHSAANDLVIFRKEI